MRYAMFCKVPGKKDKQNIANSEKLLQKKGAILSKRPNT